MSSGGSTVLPVRGPVIVLATVLTLLTALGVGLAWAVRDGGGGAPAADAPSSARSGTSAASQRTILVVLDDGSDGIVGAALMAADSSSVVSVLIPSGLRLAGLPEGHGRVADALTAGGPRLQDVVSGALQVRVDATWRLAPSALASVVDAVGGVVVDVDREVVAADVFLAAGAGQRLTGAQAAAYAAALDASEPEESRLARFGAVVSGMIQGLPAGPDRAADLVDGLAGSSLTIRPAVAGDLLAAVRRAGRDGVASVVLPVTSGSTLGEPSYVLDEADVISLVETRLPGAALPVTADDGIRVLVRNGQGTPGLSEAARQRLQSVGLRFAGGGNADSFTYLTSMVLVPSGSTADVRAGQQVAVALGLGPEAVTTTDLGTADADVVAVLGEDFAQDVLDRGVVPRPSVGSTP
jgi:hypothetical protein